MAGRHFILIILLALLTTACGQKGPLYFPEPDERDRDEETGES